MPIINQIIHDIIITYPLTFLKRPYSSQVFLEKTLAGSRQ